MRGTKQTRNVYANAIARLRQIPKSLGHSAMRSALLLDRQGFLDLFSADVAPAAAAADDAPLDALLEHFRVRTSPATPPFPKQFTDVATCTTAELIGRADRLLEHRFVLVDEPEVRFGDRIDWDFDPTPDPRRRWARELHRHRWLADLAEAYARTGDERYADTFVDLIVDWIRNNPPPRSMDESHISWTLMGVGLRCAVWPTTFFKFFDSHAFDRSIKELMLRSIHDHASFLHLFKTHDNHLLREINGLVSIASCFPEFKAAPVWQVCALQRLSEEIDKQVNADGSHVEMSSGYQWMVAEEFDAVFDTLERSGWSLPHGDLRQTLHAVYGVLAAIARPGGTWPQLGDGFMPPAEQHRRQLADAAVKLRRQDYLFVATGGQTGSPPQHCSVHFPDAGLSVMRGNWTPNALFLLMKAGPFGGVHGHEDKLSIEVSAYGQNFLVDPGTCTYNANDPFRSYFVSSNAHNTVLVDGMSQVRRWRRRHRGRDARLPEEARWISRENVDFVQAVYEDGYGSYTFAAPKRAKINFDVTHRRSVLFVKPWYWLIVDEMRCAADHELTRLFQMAPDVTVRLVNAGAVLTGAAGAVLQVLAPNADPVQLHVATGASSPIQGWTCNGQRNHKEPSAQLHMTSSATGAATLLTLLYPSAADTPVPEVELHRVALSSGQGLLAHVRIASPGLAHTEDWLLLSNDRGEKTFAGIATTAHIAGFRQHANGQRTVLFECPHTSPAGRDEHPQQQQ